MVPALTPFEVSDEEKTRENEVRAAVLRSLISSLTAKFEHRYPIALALIVSRYRREIAELTVGDEFSAISRQLRLDLISHQRGYMNDLLERGEISHFSHDSIEHTLERLEKVLKHRRRRSFNLKSMWTFISNRARSFSEEHRGELNPESVEELRQARMALENFAISYLENVPTTSSTMQQARAYLLRDHRQMLEQLEHTTREQYVSVPQTSDDDSADDIDSTPRYQTMGEQLDFLEVEALRLQLDVFKNYVKIIKLRSPRPRCYVMKYIYCR